SVMTSTMVLMSSSGLSSSAQPPSTVPPERPVRRMSVIFMGFLLLGAVSLHTRQNMDGNPVVQLPADFARIAGIIVGVIGHVHRHVERATVGSRRSALP